MQRQPLPNRVDARKFAATGTEMHAVEAVKDLPRFRAGLATDRGSVAADFAFYRDEQGFFRIDGHFTTSVDVVCERCLQAMPITIAADFVLAVVWSDEQARALPKTLDPVIVGEEGVSMRELLQEELILNTPFVNYHPPELCAAPGSAEFAPRDEKVEADKGESPFSVLGRLKSKD